MGEEKSENPRTKWVQSGRGRVAPVDTKVLFQARTAIIHEPVQHPRESSAVDAAEMLA
jgi:hypothetical protein